MSMKNRRIVGFITIVSAFFLRIWLVELEPTDNDVLASMEQMGYEGEMHYTTTEDGYILGLQRITRAPAVRYEKRETSSKYLGPVLIVHGLEGSALDWINYLGRNSLPYLLFEEGYDVWLGNARGTPSSNNHTTLDSRADGKKFWDFSFHEIGFYDLPAMIDYVTETTNSKNISYIGMSQGEATFLILSSMRPEYNKKIRIAVLTAASSHLKHSDNVFYTTLGKNWPMLQTLANAVGLNHVPGRRIVGIICQYRIFSELCKRIAVPIMGYSNFDQLESDTIWKFFQAYPPKSAFKQLVHYLQLYNTGIFRRFDYGINHNLIVYGSEKPPEYDLSKITAPVAYFWGENDCWSRPNDVSDIARKLPNLVLSYRVPNKEFNHMDVMLAKDAKKLLYDRIIQTMKDSN